VILEGPLVSGICGRGEARCSDLLKGHQREERPRPTCSSISEPVSAPALCRSVCSLATTPIVIVEYFSADYVSFTHLDNCTDLCVSLSSGGGSGRGAFECCVANRAADDPNRTLSLHRDH